MTAEVPGRTPGRPSPRVSAVLPCYNGAQYLSEALHSVLEQTRPADEVIVVDDGSTDGSAELAESFGVTVIRQANAGEGAARNRGLAAATGDLVAWLDADDRWRPQHLAVVTGLLDRHPHVLGAFGAVERFGTNHGILLGHVPGEPAVVLLEAFSGWLHTTIASVTRRSALLAIGGFDESERYSVDFDLWLRLSRLGTFVATDEVTSEWRWHGDQQSASVHRQMAAVYRYRRRFVDQVRAEGGDDVANGLETLLAHLWVRDTRDSVKSRDVATMRALTTAADLVPALRGRQRLGWGVVTRTPTPLLAAAAGLRRSLRAPLGRSS
ncbi:glycosyltransferase [Geodermatophilus normandii]|uniref:Glycosyltransferase n=1 Tax=Geodermatophilus normandii TaxID=1137989 RepID=A0A6P0GF71_9ACTN|nr:glycosyltransferase [Geodermatophilus normandii]